MNKIAKTVYLRPEVLAKAREEAERHGRSVSSLIEQVVIDHLDIPELASYEECSE
jgi:hypothetical protein